MNRCLSHFKPIKGTKTFRHTEIVNNKIHKKLISSSCPCHSSSENKKEDKSKFIKTECGKYYWVRYEFQCECHIYIYIYKFYRIC